MVERREERITYDRGLVLSTVGSPNIGDTLWVEEGSPDKLVWKGMRGRGADAGWW